MDRSIARRGALLGALLAAVLTASLAPGLATSAAAAGSGSSTGSATPRWRSVPHWYQYNHVAWRYGWAASPLLVRQDRRWQRTHPDATFAERRDWHTLLRHRWRAGHFHSALARTSGRATWYDAGGASGACGVALNGLYAASRTLPCGALVSVRHGDRYVFVRILDRGPWGSASRIIDLSPRAFGLLAPLGTGVIDVRLMHTRHRTRYDLSP